MTEWKIPEWKEVYEKWKWGRLYIPADVEYIEAEEVHVDYPQEGHDFYGYDWLRKGEAVQRKQLIQDNLSEFLYFTQPTNKGTIHTLRMLSEADNEEERAAIWIAATAFEMRNGYTSEIGNQAFKLYYSALGFLNETFYLWHHAMKRLVPEILVPYTLIEHIQNCDQEVLIALIQTNMVMLQGSYSALLYTSLGTGVRSEGYSVRLSH